MSIIIVGLGLSGMGGAAIASLLWQKKYENKVAELNSDLDLLQARCNTTEERLRLSSTRNKDLEARLNLVNIQNQDLATKYEHSQKELTELLSLHGLDIEKINGQLKAVNSENESLIKQRDSLITENRALLNDKESLSIAKKELEDENSGLIAFNNKGIVIQQQLSETIEKQFICIGELGQNLRLKEEELSKMIQNNEHYAQDLNKLRQQLDVSEDMCQKLVRVVEKRRHLLQEANDRVRFYKQLSSLNYVTINNTPVARLEFLKNKIRIEKDAALEQGSSDIDFYEDQFTKVSRKLVQVKSARYLRGQSSANFASISASISDLSPCIENRVDIVACVGLILVAYFWPRKTKN